MWNSYARHIEIDEKERQRNMEAIAEVLRVNGVTAMDFTYSYHWSNDEGQARYSLEAVHMNKKGPVSRALWEGPERARQGSGDLRFLEEDIDQEKSTLDYLNGEWVRKVQVKQMTMQRAIDDLELMDEVFMRANGQKRDEPQYDDEGGHSSITHYEGRVRWDLKTMKVVPLQSSDPMEDLADDVPVSQGVHQGSGAQFGRLR